MSINKNYTVNYYFTQDFIKKTNLDHEIQQSLHTTLFCLGLKIMVIFYHKILTTLPNLITLLIVCSLNINKKKIQTTKFNNFIGHNSFLFAHLNISLYQYTNIVYPWMYTYMVKINVGCFLGPTLFTSLKGNALIIWFWFILFQIQDLVFGFLIKGNGFDSNSFSLSI